VVHGRRGHPRVKKEAQGLCAHSSHEQLATVLVWDNGISVKSLHQSATIHYKLCAILFINYQLLMGFD